MSPNPPRSTRRTFPEVPEHPDDLLRRIVPLVAFVIIAIFTMSLAAGVDHWRAERSRFSSFDADKHDESE